MSRDDFAKVGQPTYDRIRAAAKSAKQDVQFAFQRFALERLLARIEESRWAGLYALKGGMLMLCLPGAMNRPTEDMDLSSSREVSLDDLKEALREVCAADPRQEDGLTFELDEGRTRVLKVDSPHPTVRAMMDARLHTRNSAVQVRIMLDVSQGEGIYPSLRRVRLPQTCKGFEPPELSCYPWETVVAEKLHAIVMHGAGNTRMKDYFDLIAIADNGHIPVEQLAEAVVVSFAVSGREIQPAPFGLTDEFALLKDKDWKAFVKNRRLPSAPSTMAEAVARVREFALPILGLAARRQAEAAAPDAPTPF